MTFLQPFILWGLPLALLPVLIHLLNRMRFRTQRWAAMSFLFSANRASTRYAKLRQFLILACRVLALVALCLAIARPLAGGWIGWAFSPSPDVILVLLDRSASMEAKDATNTSTRREQALRSITAAANTYAEHSRFVLIENALRKPQEIAKPELLPQLAITAATNTAADLPAMLGTAADWLAQNKTGLSEIWIASDLQSSNWQPESSRWTAVTARLAALPQTVRVRLLALTQAPAQNVSIAIANADRRTVGGQPQLHLALDLERTGEAVAALPVSITLDEVRSNFEMAMPGNTMRLHRTLPLEAAHPNGWGKIELPADGNAQDNAAYFVSGPKPIPRVAVLASDEPSGRALRLAASPSKQGCDLIPGDGSGVDWQQYALVVWQGPLPGGEVATALQHFMETGGNILFFPTGEQDGKSFGGTSWGAIENAESDQDFRVARWDEQDGPLAKTDEGLSLPVNEFPSLRRQAIATSGSLRGTFGDGKAFLVESAHGRGAALFCTTLPNREWSGLSDGRVLVPLLQRLVERGGKRFDATTDRIAGDPELIEHPEGWTAVDAVKKDVRFDAGIYRNGSRLIAVNRPVEEEAVERVEPQAARRLFGPLTFQFFEERGADPAHLQSEIWRTLLVVLLVLMLAEAVLSLPMNPTRMPISSASPSRVQEMSSR